MEMIYWIAIIGFFFIGFIGLLFPAVPSVVAIWLSFLIYRFGLQGEELSTAFWVMMVIFTAVLIVSDILANSYFVNKYGGSKWGKRVAAISVVFGAFIIPPFGLILVPFLSVFLVEKLQNKTTHEAFQASIGCIIGFLSSTLAKFIVQSIMVLWFFIELLF